MTTYPNAEPVYGKCLHCGSVETALIFGVRGHLDLSDIGESPEYPYGYGCELCA